MRKQLLLIALLMLASVGFSQTPVRGEKGTRGNRDCEDVFSEFSATACHSYVWNGIAYTESGDYVQTFEIGNGMETFFYDFDNTPEYYDDWQFLSADDDDYYWDIYTGDGYGHNSSDFMASFSYYDGEDFEPDNFVVLPYAFINSNSKLRFWARQLTDGWEDILGIYVTTATDITTTADFEQVGSDLTISSGTWTQYTFDLGAYAGQTVGIAFRHYNCYGQHAVLVDDIELYLDRGNAPAVSFNNNNGNDVRGERNQLVAIANDRPQGSHIESVFGHANIANASTRDFCDSIVTLHLTITGGPTYEFYDTACDSYDWNGETYTESGDYEQTFAVEIMNGGDEILFSYNFDDVTEDYTEWQWLTADDDTLNWGFYTGGGYGLNGSDFLASFSYYNGTDLEPDNFILLPYTTISSNTKLGFWARQLTYGWEDVLGVFVTTSTDITSTADFEQVGNDMVLYDTVWNRYILDLGAYAGQTLGIAFRHYNCYGQHAVLLDDIVLYNTGGRAADIVFNAIPSNIVRGERNQNMVAKNEPSQYSHIASVPGHANIPKVDVREICDSTVTLHLTINPTLYGDYYASICDNDLPFIWHGVTFDGSDTQTITVEEATSAGCDSIVTLHVTVNPTLYGDYYATICDAQLPYTWYGVTFEEAGTQTTTLENATAAGCDSIVTLHLEVNPVLTGDYYATICDAQLPFTWHGETFTGSGTQTITIENATVEGCDSLVTLHVTVNPELTGDYYATVCESELPYTWHGVTFDDAGEETITIEDATVAGCDSIVTLHVTVNPTLTGDYFATICESELPYTWYDVTFAEAGEETITLENATAVGCDSIVTLHLTVNPSLTGDYYTTICESELPYTWYDVTFAEAGEETVTIENATAAGCDSIVTLHLTVNSTLTGENYVEVCEDKLPYVWHGGLYNAAGSYPITLEGVTAQGCDSIVTLVLSILEAPEVVVTGDTLVSLGGETTLTATGAYSYLWSTGETTASITVSPTAESTTYTVIGVSVDGCTSTAEITVYTFDGILENNFSMSIYPNPVKNVVTVEAEDILNIRLVDMLGQTLYDSNEEGDAAQVDMSSFADGVYFMQVKTVNGIATQKVVKK